MVDKYNGQFEYALAAYNAGSDRVGDWLGQGHYRDAQEFVESIPSPKPANMSKRFCGMQAFTESYTERRSQFPKGPSRIVCSGSISFGQCVPSPVRYDG